MEGAGLKLRTEVIRWYDDVVVDEDKVIPRGGSRPEVPRCRGPSTVSLQQGQADRPRADGIDDCLRAGVACVVDDDELELFWRVIRRQERLQRRTEHVWALERRNDDRKHGRVALRHAYQPSRLRKISSVSRLQIASPCATAPLRCSATMPSMALAERYSRTRLLEPPSIVWT